MISTFEQWLDTATQQQDAQRLLMLFAKAEVETTKLSNDQQRGSIAPVMCVDKLPTEITSFKALTTEADNINKDWNFILIAGLTGKGTIPPTPEEAGEYLNKVVNDVTNGQDLSRYVIFDREKTLLWCKRLNTISLSS